MKHIVIGDLHGKDVWREINIKNYDKVVFLGDYVDSFTLPDLVIDQNLQDIIQLKKEFPDKIVLLLGNHDMQYMFYPYLRCSGFRDSMKRPLKALFNINENLFQIAYQHGNYLFTHAGLTNAWYLEFMQIPRWRIKDSPQTLADILNAANAAAIVLYYTGAVLEEEVKEAVESYGRTRVKRRQICWWATTRSLAIRQLMTYIAYRMATHRYLY